jgi:phosphoribosylformylglycinamidine synthase
VAVVVVDVMPKPELLDPQGQAVQAALRRLGLATSGVRQGKRFELVVDGPADAALLASVEEVAAALLANPVIEDYAVRVEDA